MKTNGVRWPEELEAKFLDLYAQGLGPKTIAIKLGLPHNAIIGKANRMNLPWKDAKLFLQVAKDEKESQAQCP
jgi:hypothetical protein